MRRGAALLSAFALGAGLAACGDRENRDEGNPGDHDLPTETQPRAPADPALTTETTAP